MKKTLLLLLLVPVICPGQMKQDTQAHMAFGTFAGIAGSGIVWQKTGNRWLSIGTGIVLSSVIGTAKEQYDYNRKGLFSERDLKNTILGGLIGCISFQIILGKRAVHRKKMPSNILVYNE